jgi:hypothetical protein
MPRAAPPAAAAPRRASPAATRPAPPADPPATARWGGPAEDRSLPPVDRLRSHLGHDPIVKIVPNAITLFSDPINGLDVELGNHPFQDSTNSCRGSPWRVTISECWYCALSTLACRPRPRRNLGLRWSRAAHPWRWLSLNPLRSTGARRERTRENSSHIVGECRHGIGLRNTAMLRLSIVLRRELGHLVRTQRRSSLFRGSVLRRVPADDVDNGVLLLLEERLIRALEDRAGAWAILPARSSARTPERQRASRPRRLRSLRERANRSATNL